MKPLRILYVEDSSMLRESIGMLLEGASCEVVACATGEEALALEKAAGHFDALMTDVNLPGMSGIDLARYLLQQNPGRWVILCTGSPLPESVQLGPNVRMLPKPFELEQLDALLDEIACAPTRSGAG